VLALISFSDGELAGLDFGKPLEPAQSREEQVRAILADYPRRKAELLDIGFSPAVTILTEMLEASGDEAIKILPPIRALGFLGRPQGAAAVSKHINHSDRQVRLATIRTLGQMGKFDSITLVQPFLESPIREERREAIIAMGKFSKPELIPPIEAAADRDPELVKLATEAKARITATLKGIQTKNFSEFVDAVIDTDEYEDIVALILVTWRPLQQLLSDKTRSPQTRARAARLLGMARARKAGPPMRKILADTDEALDLRLRAAEGLGLTRTRSAVDQLAALLTSSEPGMREVSILSLGRIGDARALEPLLQQWDAAGGTIRPQLRLALSRICSRPEIPALLEPLRVYQPRAVDEVHFISDSLALSRGYRRELIAPYLNHRDTAARRDALLLLATFGTDSDSVELKHYRNSDPDPLNQEIANLGLERLKDIPIWERP
jgi:HEAT repeat protein